MRNYLIKMGTGIINTISGQRQLKVSEDSKKDYLLLSCQQVSVIIRKLLDNKGTIICDLSDRNGPVHELIASIEGTTIRTVDENILTMTDNYLYDIFYNRPLDNFKLCEHDEYFEEIPV